MLVESKQNENKKQKGKKTFKKKAETLLTPKKREQVIKQLQDSPRPLRDEIFQDLAEKLGIEIEDLKTVSKKALKEKIPGGLSEGKGDSDFDPKAIAKGQKVEMEHTTDPEVAKEIARDHLTEDPKYYEKLERMEAGKCASRVASRYHTQSVVASVTQVTLRYRKTL